MCRAAVRSGREDASLCAPHLSVERDALATDRKPREQTVERPAVDDTVRRNAGEPGMGDGGLRIDELTGGNAPSAPSKSVSGTSSARIAAAARL